MPPITSDDLHRIFKNLDKNNNGQVSIEELHRLIDIIGICTTLDELEIYVGRKTLDFIEFLFFYEAMFECNTAVQKRGDDHDHHTNDLFEAFKVFDLNGDGYISSAELESVLSRLELWDRESGRDCKDMIGVYDENSDGVLDFEEFKNMMSATFASTSNLDV